MKLAATSQKLGTNLMFAFSVRQDIHVGDKSLLTMLFSAKEQTTCRQADKDTDMKLTHLGQTHILQTYTRKDSAH